MQSVLFGLLINIALINISRSRYHDMQFAGGTSLTTPQVKSELTYQLKRLSHHPSIAMWDGCNECGGLGDYMNFVMPVVASIDSSRPIWPSCPAPGWVTGVDRLSARPNGKKLLTGLGGTNQSIGEGRPSGYPFSIEGHGPYTAFMGKSSAAAFNFLRRRRFCHSVLHSWARN